MDVLVISYTAPVIASSWDISFKALGGKSFGRIDIKMDHLGVPHFIEANLMPGLRKGYFYRSCVLNLDMSYEDMIFSIANTGLSSH